VQAGSEHRRAMKLAVRTGATPRPHGKANTYNDGCRCAPCVAAAAAYRLERKRLIALGLTNVTHGKWGTYVGGCKCAACLEIGSRYQAARAVARQSISDVARARLERWRESQRIEILATCSPEILELINDQRRDEKAGAVLVRRMVALDAPHPVSNDSRYESLGDPWDDPTTNEALQAVS